ncbi:MAG: glycosyltransferase, partial [Pseudomonadota bacterium]
MNVLLVAIGTRGDMEPVITLGQLLQDRGHQVSVLLPEQFCALAQQARLNPISLGPRWYEFMMSILNSFTDASMSWWKRCTSLLSAIKESKPIHDEIAKHIHNTVITTNPDRIVFSAKALFAAIYNIDQPGRAIFHCPLPYLHKTRYHTHVGFKGRKAGAWLNKLSYRLVDHKVTKLLVDSAKQLNIAHVDKQSVKNVLETQTAIYTLSPALFERPKDWRDNIKVLGFHERDKTDQWSPDNALLSFLDRHEKILFVTFGSMTNSKP